MARRKKQLKAIQLRPLPFYSLNTIKELLRAPNPPVHWIARKDGRTDFEKLGYSLSDALNILRSLHARDFDLSIAPTRSLHSQAVDVYKVEKINVFGEKLKIYIKLFVRAPGALCQSATLVVVSFHS